MIITIDGPAASGKSTIAKRVANKLGYDYMASGYLYRALGYVLVCKKNYSEEQLSSVKYNDIHDLFDQDIIRYGYDQDNQKALVYYNDNNIAPKLKDAYIDKLAARVALNSGLREAVCTYQRQYARKANLVAEGRDTGSYVFADNADYKFYLTASLEVRAQRWQEDQQKKGYDFTLEQSKKAISERDTKDINRSVGPLVIPKDAHVIDNSDLTIEQSVNKILDIINS